MTQTNSPSAHPSTAAGADLSLHSADILLNLVVIFLAPIFLSASNGDLTLARLAAIETVNSYRANSQADLLAVAQIVALGFATLGSLCLSMADDLSLTMVLRLRGNANALSRSAEVHRRRLERRADISPPPIPAQPPVRADQPQADEPQADEPPIQSPAVTPAAPRQAQPAVAAPAATPAPVSIPPADSADPSPAQWAAACVEAAEQLTAELSHLPPEEQQLAVLQASILNSCAADLLSGTNMEPPEPGQR